MELYASSLLFRPPFHPLFDSVTSNAKTSNTPPPPLRDQSPNGGKGDGGMSASKKVGKS